MNKPKILLVDDEEGIRLAVKYSLDDWFSVTSVATTAEARELLKKEKFNLVLLDIFITGEGQEASIETLKFITKEYPALPVVILSGTVSWMQKWDELKQLGASAYLSKPFERSKIKEIADKCISGQKMDTIW